MSVEDMLKGTGAVAAVGLVSVAAVGIATLITRHPETARRAVRTLMHGARRVGLALAQTREELGDLWAEAREELRDDLDFAEVRRTTESWAEDVVGSAPAGDAERPSASRTSAKATKKSAKAPKKKAGKRTSRKTPKGPPVSRQRTAVH
jgi:hypothetical protein